MTPSANPWDTLIPYIEAMDAAALERLGKSLDEPIIEPPRDPWLLEHCWKMEEQ